MVLGKEKKIEIVGKVTSLSPTIDRDVNYSLYVYEYKGEAVWSVFNEIHLKVYVPFRGFNNFILWN